MTKILSRLAIGATFCFSLMLTGCPVSSKYPLGVKGAVPADNNLLGTWAQDDEKTEATKVKITKGKEDNTYNLVVEEKGEAFMADATQFKAWLTVINNQNFLVLQENQDEKPSETYYVYHIKTGNNSITTNDITLKEKGADAITSIDAYRAEVTASIKSTDFLAGEIKWTRK